MENQCFIEQRITFKLNDWTNEQTINVKYRVTCDILNLRYRKYVVV